MSVSGFAGFLKGKSGLTVYKRWSDIKFRCKGEGDYPRERTPVRLQDIYKEDALSDRLTQDLPNPFTDGKQQNAPAGVLYAVSVAGSKKVAPVV